MLAAIREFFDAHVAAPRTRSERRHTIELATAALLVEMVRMDREIDPAERDAVHNAVRARFGLSADEADTLVRLAEEESRQATDYYQFTSLINRHFSAEQKEQVIEHLWEVAYADGRLDAHEDHLVRKVADLVHVPHATYVAAKLRARDAAAQARVAGPEAHDGARPKRSEPRR
jgi:uncharacterized tellurite resistance protein B-like protein